MSDLQKYLEKRLKDPNFKKHWDESRLEYEVARQIIHLRKHLGMTQDQLAQKLHTQQSEISRIESCEQNISLDKLQKIVEALDGNIEITITKNKRPEPVKH